MDVCITFRLRKEDFDSLTYTNFELVNCFEVLEKYGYDIMKHSTTDRLNFIATEIINSKKNSVICDVSLDYEGTIYLSEFLRKSNIEISKIIVPNQIKRNKHYQEGLEAYRYHNRWLDFYPGQIEDVYNEFEELIAKVKLHFQDKKTTVIEC